jgi:hypothetical protein
MSSGTVTARLRCENPACEHEWTIRGTVTACPECKNTTSTILRIDMSREASGLDFDTCMRCGSTKHVTRDCPIGTMP